ncbi:MAG TPA: hypothetical protein VFF11_00050, partial [Candidatus Binatia bacterium]|nr:hypothetical protein [Candidatus Binatia bacterium]
LLNAVSEIARAVLEQHNEAKSESNKESEPQKTTQDRHPKRLGAANRAINRLPGQPDFGRSGAICAKRRR